MTIECTIRFKREANEAKDRALWSILTMKETETVQGVVGGFFFKTDRSASAILAAFEEDGFDFSDFENIDFRPL